jgi:hypothetical protein
MADDGDLGFVSAIRHLPSAILYSRESAMTDLREKTFRLTQFARCAG